MTTAHTSGCEFEGNIRLVDGQNEFEGRVEVCKSGQWKTVCNRDWGNEEAAVVCRQIGRFSGSSVGKLVIWHAKKKLSHTHSPQ